MDTNYMTKSRLCYRGFDATVTLEGVRVALAHAAAHVMTDDDGYRGNIQLGGGGARMFYGLNLPALVSLLDQYK